MLYIYIIKINNLINYMVSIRKYELCMYKKFIPLPAWFVRLHHQTQNPLSTKEKIQHW